MKLIWIYSFIDGVFTLKTVGDNVNATVSAYMQRKTTAHPNLPVVPIVDLGYVTLTGLHERELNLNHFRGIRYAAPPLSELRWRRPRAVEQSGIYINSPVVDATQWGDICVQGFPSWVNSDIHRVKFDFKSVDGFRSSMKLLTEIFMLTVKSYVTKQTRTPGMSEDCLYLDIITPGHANLHRNTVKEKNRVFDKLIGREKLPVIVQFHGGSNSFGFPQMYPGESLVTNSDSRLIYVSVQSRLGLFGYLAGKSVMENGDLNVGLHDQLQALKWIKNHIESFGGDLNRVTIMGAAAGGSSAIYQLMRNEGLADKLFHGVIAEYPWFQPLIDSNTQREQYNAVLKVAKCTNISCLRQKTENQLISIGNDIYTSMYGKKQYGYGTSYFGPVIDHYFIHDAPSSQLSTGRYIDVPLLIDHSKYEGLLFTNNSIRTEKDIRREATRVFPHASKVFYDDLLQVYPYGNYNATVWRYQDIVGDALVNCPTYYLASSAVRYKSENRHRMFKMIFESGSQVHGATAPYIYSGLPEHTRAQNATISRILTSYIISFVQTGDPNTLKNEDMPEWIRYSNMSSVLQITDSGFQNVKDPDDAFACRFMKNASAIIGN